MSPPPSRVPLEPVSVHRWGPAGDPPDIVLLCLHDGAAGPLLDGLGLTPGDLGHPAALVAEYLEIERDVGSAALTQALAARLHALRPALRVVEVRAELPRGLVDCGRVPGAALRAIVRSCGRSTLPDDLARRHAAAIAAVRGAILSLDPLTGVFLDVHTMAPFDPPVARTATRSEAIRDDDWSLADYVELWRCAFRGGRARPIDLIVSVAGRPVSDAALTDALRAALSGKGYDVALDVPYASGDHLVGGWSMQRRRGLVVDVPKSMLTVGLEGHRLRVDPGRVSSLAHDLAVPLVDILDGPRAPTPSRVGAPVVHRPPSC